MLVDNTIGWPPDLQILGTEKRINFLAFPQSPERVRLYICYALEDKKRFAGADNQARFLDAFRLATVPRSEFLANGTPSGPCNSYGNEDTWTDVPYVPGVVLIGDAAGHNDPIIGQGLSIAYRDVRIVRDLMLENRNWAPDLFRPYAEERRERMRRLRLTASTFSMRPAAVDTTPANGDQSPRRAFARDFPLMSLPPPSSDPKSRRPKCLTRRYLDRLRAMRCCNGQTRLHNPKARRHLRKRLPRVLAPAARPLLRGFAKTMRAVKTVQSHTVHEDAGKQIRTTRPKMKETYDGITEVWWDSL